MRDDIYTSELDYLHGFFSLGLFLIAILIIYLLIDWLIDLKVRVTDRRRERETNLSSASSLHNWTPSLELSLSEAKSLIQAFHVELLEHEVTFTGDPTSCKLRTQPLEEIPGPGLRWVQLWPLQPLGYSLCLQHEPAACKAKLFTQINNHCFPPPSPSPKSLYVPLVYHT